jgi:hypothetical protein
MPKIALALGLVVALSGCVSAVQQGPSDTLRTYSEALEQGRVDDAYRMLSDEAKRSMSLEAFRRAVRENPEDVAEIARALARPSGDPQVTAVVSIPNGDELLLIYEGGKWRIDAAAVDLYSQATPRQTLVGFLRAFDKKRYDVVLRFVPDAEREGSALLEGDDAPKEAAKPGDAPKAEAVKLTPEKLKESWEGPQREQINRIVQAIKTALPTAQIEETGDSAAMTYGAGGTVSLVREHGLWKIRDF